MRPPHYWRKPKTTALPSNILIFDTETLPTEYGGCGGLQLHKLRLGYAIGYRIEGDKLTREAECEFKDAGKFWAFVERRLDKKRPLWVFAHNIAFDLGVVGGWQILASKACKWRHVAVDSPIFYMKGAYRGKPVVLADTFNYYRCSLASIGKSTGTEKRGMPGFGESDRRWLDYCRGDVETLSAGILALIRFWRGFGLGPWAATISALAFSAFRTRFMSHKVLVHGVAELLRLERAAYYGGLVDTPHIGRRVRGPIYECDVNSMYPACCLEPLPTQPIEYITRNAHVALRRLRPELHYIADVELRSTNETYPVRVSQRVYYPIGSYRTALQGAELRRAVSAGNVSRVFRVGVYQTAPIFADYVRYFHDLKSNCERTGDEAWRTIAKSLMNNLYGKTGQQSPRWVPLSPDAWQTLETTLNLPRGTFSRYYNTTLDLSDYETTLTLGETDHAIRIRNLWGSTELLAGRVESRDSVPSIAGAVTSIARERIRNLARSCGYHHHYYTDTDSVWTDARGLRRLEQSKLIGAGDLGTLQVKGSYADLIVWGRKDYQAGDTIRLKGIRHPDQPEDDGSYKQLHFPCVTTQLKDNVSAGVIVREVTKRLSRTPDHCHVGKDGWTRPLEFPDDLPESARVSRLANV